MENKIQVCLYNGNYPNFFKCGGNIVIHYLIKILNKKKINSYLYSKSTNIYNPHNTPLTNIINTNTIVIYPEIIKDNPLNANTVCRWILYDPFKRYGIKSWSKNDILLSYGNYNPIKCHIDLSICRFDDNIFKFSKKKKIHKYYIIHKAKLNGWTQENLNIEIRNLNNLGFQNLNLNLSNEKINELLSECLILVSFDTNTYISNAGVLCGCLSVIYKGNNCSKTYNEILKYRGVYGNIGLKPFKISLLEEKYNYEKRLEEYNLYIKYIKKANNVDNFIKYFNL